MLDKPDRPYKNDDEATLAAGAMAAVFAYIRAEAESAGKPSAKLPAASGWAAEALLEGTSLPGKVSSPLPEGVRRRPWFGASLKFLFCLAAAGVALLPLPAGAQYGDMPPATAPLLLRVGIVPESQTITLAVPDGAEICD